MRAWERKKKKGLGVWGVEGILQIESSIFLWNDDVYCKKDVFKKNKKNKKTRKTRKIRN
jgi:hypothetical protein